MISLARIFKVEKRGLKEKSAYCMSLIFIKLDFLLVPGAMIFSGLALLAAEAKEPPETVQLKWTKIQAVLPW